MQIGSQLCLIDRRERFGELFAGGVGVGAQEREDFLDLFAQVLHRFEPGRLNAGDVGDAFLVLEEVEPGLAQVRTEFVDGFEREPAFAFPTLTDGFQKPAIFNLPRRGTGNFDGVGGGDQRR